MRYKEVMAVLAEREISKEERTKKLEDLEKFIKSRNHLCDDCSFAFMREQKSWSKFLEEAN